MKQGPSKQDVTPFFKIQKSDLALNPGSRASKEEVWLEKEKLMMAILDSIHDGVFTIDFNMKVSSFNQAAERITGYTAGEAIGKSCMDVFCTLGGMKEDCMVQCPMRKTMQHQLPITKKRTICNKKGQILTVTATTNLLYDLNNQPIGGVETIVDVTEFERLKEKWQGKKYNLGNIVGKSPKMLEMYDLIESLSGSTSSVLIQGETGTGKGLIANAVHYHSPKRRGPFVHVNCAAIPETLLESELFGHVKGAFTGAVSDRKGRFELAHKGSIFLDEIGELSQGMQAKLLRAVEEKKFEKVGGNTTINIDVRIIAATNMDLEEDVQNNKFRKDLFFRLNIIPIKLPSLGERLEDVPLLVEHFVDKFNFKMGKQVKELDPEIMNIFIKYPWPGNVRELESVMEYAFIQCNGNYIETRCLPPRFKMLSTQTTDISLSKSVATEVFQAPESNRTYRQPTEEERIRRALETSRWKKTEAARKLNVSRTTLWRLMKKYNLE